MKSSHNKHYTNSKKKVSLTFLVFLAFALPLMSAVTLDSGTVLNATGSNSTMNFSITVNVDQATVANNAIYLENTTYTQGNLQATIAQTTQINWSEPNTNLDSAHFPYISFQNLTSVKISNRVNQTLNVTMVVSGIDCTYLGRVTYKTDSRSYSQIWNRGDYTCVGNTITFPELPVEYATSSNEFFLETNEAIQGICQDGQVQMQQAVPLIGTLLAVILIGAAIAMLLLSFSGYIDVDLRNADANWKSLVGSVLIIGLTMVILITIVFVFGGAYCTAIGG